MTKCGVYLITFKSDSGDKFYVGSSVNIKKREKDHASHLRRGNHDNDRMQKLFNKYGKYDFTILEECSKDIVREREKVCMDEYFDKHGSNVINLTRNTDCSFDDPSVREKTNNALRALISKEIICTTINRVFTNSVEAARILSEEGYGDFYVGNITSCARHKLASVNHLVFEYTSGEYKDVVRPKAINIPHKIGDFIFRSGLNLMDCYNIKSPKLKKLIDDGIVVKVSFEEYQQFRKLDVKPEPPPIKLMTTEQYMYNGIIYNSASEVGDALSIKRRTVFNWIDKGKIQRLTKVKTYDTSRIK